MKTHNSLATMSTMTRTYPVLLILFVMGLLTLMVVGCSGRTADISLRTGIPCSPPCWHNLVPGESGEEDVCRELEASPYVRAGTLRSWGEGVLRVYGWASRRGNSNWIRLRDGKVWRMDIRPDYNLAIGEVVSLFGPPDGVYAYVEGNEQIVYGLILDYPTRGLEFSAYGDARHFSLTERTATITGKEPVTVVYYYAPQSLESALRGPLACSPLCIGSALRDEQEWPGIGGIVVLAEYPRR